MSDPLDAVLSKLGSVRASGNGFMAKCPAHEDRRESLSITQAGDGKVLLKCHAGCTTEAVVAALGLKMSDLFTKNGDWAATNEKKIVATYDYRDEDGRLLFEVVRYEPKGFAQRRPDGRGGWTWNLDGIRRVPYRLPELLAAPKRAVFATEGEKDATNLERLGFLATTNPGGAGKWRKLDPEAVEKAFRGRNAIIIPDKDDPGRKHARDVARRLWGIASEIRVLELPGDGKDTSDWIDAGGTAEELKELARGTQPLDAPPPPECEDPRVEVADDASVSGALSGEERHAKYKTCTWPAPLEQLAFHGPAGEFVHIVEPHSEADPAALLTSFLVAFGNVAGRRVYAKAEGDRHYANLFVTLVGATSKGRKGSSWGHVHRLFQSLDSEWSAQRVVRGLASGEGIIYAVRDPVAKGDKIVDEGVADKRCLVYESEFALPLQVLRREGNILSPVLRNLWDSGNAQNLTKNSPLRATGAHVSILAHATREELKGTFRTVDFCNGFANRFLWIGVRRSKILPRGGSLNPEELAPVETLLRAAVRFAEEDVAVSFDPAAGALWDAVYEDLSEGRPGTLGMALGRAEAQVLRLAVIYALLERSAEIHLIHLEAALAVWRYAADSAAWIFGTPEEAEQGERAVVVEWVRRRREGVTARDLAWRGPPKYRKAGGSKLAEQHLEAAVRAGLLSRKTVKDEAGGRASIRYFGDPCDGATCDTTDKNGREIRVPSHVAASQAREEVDL